MKSHSPEERVPSEEALRREWEEMGRLQFGVKSIANVLELMSLQTPVGESDDIPAWARRYLNGDTERGMIDMLHLISEQLDENNISLRVGHEKREAHYRSRLADAVGATFDADKA